VRTRTLLLLAVACGLVILVAGVVQLLRIAGQDEGAEWSPLGSTVQVGDLEVVVESYDESADTAHVAVRLGGVDDVDAAADFRLVVPGADQPLRPTAGGAGACGAVTVATAACELTFDIGAAPGGLRVLRLERGDNTAQWEVTDTSAT
jgi:hypothetical protein